MPFRVLSDAKAVESTATPLWEDVLQASVPLLLLAGFAFLIWRYRKQIIGFATDEQQLKKAILFVLLLTLINWLVNGVPQIRIEPDGVLEHRGWIMDY